MPDEIGTETTCSDARSAGEVLFGDEVDDAAADAVEEEASNTDAEQEPQGSGDAGDQAGLPEELKVVVSVRGDRATIGVQQPSSDPHIESFDVLDLSGLAGEVPGGGRKGKGQMGGRTQEPGQRETRSPGKAPDPA